MSEKPQINRALIAALEHFGRIRFNWSEPTLFRYQRPPDERGERLQEEWTVEGTCRLAQRVLEEEDLAVLKLEHLKRGLKRYGGEDLYEMIMGEKLDAQTAPAKTTAHRSQKA